jgi:Flp pilus assembly protein TadB
LSFGRCIVVLCLLEIQRPKDKEKQYNEYETKSNNTATKRQKATIQQPKDKEQQDSNQKKKNNNTTTKNKEQQYSDQKTKRFSCSFSFGRCFLALCLLVAVLLFFEFWSLYCFSCLLVAVFLFFVFW